MPKLKTIEDIIRDSNKLLDDKVIKFDNLKEKLNQSFTKSQHNMMSELKKLKIDINILTRIITNN